MFFFEDRSKVRSGHSGLIAERHFPLSQFCISRLRQVVDGDLAVSQWYL